MQEQYKEIYAWAKRSFSLFDPLYCNGLVKDVVRHVKVWIVPQSSRAVWDFDVDLSRSLRESALCHVLKCAVAKHVTMNMQNM